MKMLALAGLAGLTLAAAGCGSGTHHNDPAAAKLPAKAPASPTACDPADDSCIPPDHPTTGPIAVPALEVGKPFRYQAGGDDGAITQEVTLLKLHTAKSIPYPDEDYTARPDAGHVYLCINVKIRNVGSTPGDTYTTAQWYGLDGKVEEAALAGGAGCEPFGMSDDLSGEPNPQPGKYVTGSTLFQLSTAVGALEFTDRQGSPLYRIDYGPQSAQVKIDARGQ